MKMPNAIHEIMRNIEITNYLFNKTHHYLPNPEKPIEGGI
jgi:hypothetical protein